MSTVHRCREEMLTHIALMGTSAGPREKVPTTQDQRDDDAANDRGKSVHIN